MPAQCSTSHTVHKPSFDKLIGPLICAGISDEEWTCAPMRALVRATPIYDILQSLHAISGPLTRCDPSRFFGGSARDIMRSTIAQYRAFSEILTHRSNIHFSAYSCDPLHRKNMSPTDCSNSGWTRSSRSTRARADYDQITTRDVTVVEDHVQQIVWWLRIKAPTYRLFLAIRFMPRCHSKYWNIVQYLVSEGRLKTGHLIQAICADGGKGPIWGHGKHIKLEGCVAETRSVGGGNRGNPGFSGYVSLGRGLCSFNISLSHRYPL
jgi:hypothetical protein